MYTTTCPKCSHKNPITFLTVHNSQEECQECSFQYSFSKKQAKENKKNHSTQELRSLISKKKGIVIFQKNVAKSGMSRTVSIYTHDNTAFLNYHIANVLDLPTTQEQHLRLSGCGMDMHFWIADALTSVLYTKKEKEKLTGNGKGCLPWKSIF